MRRLPGKIIFSLLGRLLLFTVMILANVTPIWFCCRGPVAACRPCWLRALELLIRGAQGFGDVKLGALLVVAATMISWPALQDDPSHSDRALAGRQLVFLHRRPIQVRRSLRTLDRVVLDIAA